MKGWIVEQLSEDGAMRWADLPSPVPGPDQLRVRVEAAGVNFLDTLMIRGRYQTRPELPFTPGVELAGEVVEAGPGSEFQPGERVAAALRWGAFAEEVLVTEDEVAFRLPASLPFAEAASMLITYPSAHLGLFGQARLCAGETLLVHAGAGGVGSAAIQLGKAAGARVIATAGGPEKTALVETLGADHAIDYRREAWLDRVKALTGGEGAHVIFDPVGDVVGEESLRALAFGGRYVVIGFAGGRIPMLPANRLLLKHAAAVGVFWGEFRRRHPEQARAIFDDLLRLHAEGKIAPLLRDRFALSDAPQALAALGARRTVGKVILEAQAHTQENRNPRA